MIASASLSNNKLREGGYVLVERDPDYVVLGETRSYRLRAHRAPSA